MIPVLPPCHFICQSCDIWMQTGLLNVFRQHDDNGEWLAGWVRNWNWEGLHGIKFFFFAYIWNIFSHIFRSGCPKVRHNHFIEYILKLCIHRIFIWGETPFAFSWPSIDGHGWGWNSNTGRVPEERWAESRCDTFRVVGRHHTPFPSPSTPDDLGLETRRVLLR